MFAFSVIKYRGQPAAFCYFKAGRFSVGSDGQQRGVCRQAGRVGLERGTLGAPAAAALPWGTEGKEAPAPTHRGIDPARGEPSVPMEAPPVQDPGACPYPGRPGRASRSPLESPTPLTGAFGKR